MAEPPILTEIPDGLEQILKTYGNAVSFNFERENLVEVELPFILYYGGAPVHRCEFHRMAAPNLLQALNAVLKAGLQEQIQKDYGGTYCFRKSRTTGMLSTHSWGIAIDLRVKDFPLGSTNRLPDSVVKCFNDAGFLYGGDFHGERDPMHMQLCTSY
jgi:hypothetical protein